MLALRWGAGHASHALCDCNLGCGPDGLHAMWGMPCAPGGAGLSLPPLESPGARWQDCPRSWLEESQAGVNARRPVTAICFQLSRQLQVCSLHALWMLIREDFNFRAVTALAASLTSTEFQSECRNRGYGGTPACCRPKIRFAPRVHVQRTGLRWPLQLDKVFDKGGLNSCYLQE